MGLSFRYGTVDDISRAHELAATGSRGMYDAETLKHLPDVWRTWLKDKRAELHCMIDDSLPLARRMQGVVLGVYATDAFTDALLKDPFENVARAVVNAEASGKSVVLNPDELAHANAHQGLNGLGLDFAFEGDWGGLTFLRWTQPLYESLRAWTEGWRARVGLREWIGRDLYRITRINGWPLVKDFGKGVKPAPEPSRRRYLTALSLKQHLRLPDRLPAALFFTYREPRFHFTPAEQDLLMLAVRNVSDAEAAERLSLSPHTVKARWKAIFQQVADQKPDWFPHRSDDEPESATRGVEKRRHLLAWLGKHMEELRPRSR